MPLTKGQTEILRVLANARSPDSYVAGSTPLNVNEQRGSGDVDIFHDSDAAAAEAADRDAKLLKQAGYKVSWQRRAGGAHTLIAEKDGEQIKLEWVADSDFRFFPVITDPVFGYMLHPVDLATNKVMAAATRREVRDIVDVLTAHRTIAPLGALVWAAVEKSPGFTPEGLIGEIRRNLHHPMEEWRQLLSSDPIDPAATVEALRQALDEAETFVERMPTAKAGLLFLDATGAVVQPDPSKLAELTEHSGQRRGHWPQNPQVTQALMERLKQSRRIGLASEEA
jgi:hypothetical protein